MRKLSALLVLALVAALFQVSFAAPRTVTMWTFTPNNYAEWSNQKPEIEKRLGITLDLTMVLPGRLRPETAGRNDEWPGCTGYHRMVDRKQQGFRR